MSAVSSRFQVPVPSTDILTYIFDSPRSPNQGHTDNEPLILSAQGIEEPSCTFNHLKHLVKCFASGFGKRAQPSPRVVIYGTLNVNLPAVLLGSIGAGASCNICPAYPLAETTARFQTLTADFVFFEPRHLETVTAAAKAAGIPAENLFVLDDFEKCEESRYPVSHWSLLLDLMDGPTFEWRKLSEEEAKTTTAMFCHTSGYAHKFFR
ncbi:hypothetical protein N7481_001207 [Penicillium waksmanii]|uniref:uncharacterized protein n=1 Tax=Penicillium waksmanii TaxID=69791 RepID=UPI00254779E9|nr:uncharacterized protein N7481_001207 [Penicillium waksmanii]KAJ6000798.1 hypothetical protein N7481_001207 [Penicillium waksmanii]